MMKRTMITGLLFIALIGAGLAQDTTVTWVSQSGVPIAREQASFLRKVWQEQEGLWQVHDYYPEGGLQMSGSYSNLKERTKEGLFICYTKEGTKTSEGHYQNNYAVGFWSFWHDNGALRDQGKYLRAATAAERDSIMERLAQLKEMGPAMHWESFKDSTWTYFHENGVRSGVEHYLSGKLVEAQYWNEDGSEVAPGAVVNRMPEYPGGLAKLMRYLSKNIKYPKTAKNNKIHGTVYISFIVNESGVLEDVAVLRSVHPDLDSAAIRVVEAMPNWNPALAQNRPVRVQYNLPIQFMLQ